MSRSNVDELSLVAAPRWEESGGNQRAFSLVELMTAIAVLALIVVILAGISNHMSRMWVHGVRQSDYRNRARSAVNMIGREMVRAFVSPNTADKSLQFVLNPANVSFNHPNSVFWSSPIATSTKSGNLALVGYFIRRDDSTRQVNLYRYFVNPDDAENYLIYSNPSTWITDGQLNKVAPGDKSKNYQGLFLENVLGLWVNCYKQDGSLYTSYDSRNEGNRLPYLIKIALVFLDVNTVRQHGDLQPASSGLATPEDYVAQLPASVGRAAEILYFTVRPENCR